MSFLLWAQVLLSVRRNSLKKLSQSRNNQMNPSQVRSKILFPLPVCQLQSLNLIHPLKSDVGEGVKGDDLADEIESNLQLTCKF